MLKRAMIPLAMATLIGLHAPAFAAEPASHPLFEKYTNVDGYTVINVGPGLFEFATIFSDQLEPLKQIKGVRILRAKNEAAGKALSEAYSKLLDDNNYVEMVDIIETDKKTTVYGIKEDQVIREILVVENSNHPTIISMHGMLDKATVHRIQQTLQSAHCKEHSGKNKT